MTVIRPNSISGVTSITAQGGDINFYRADGTAGDLTINNIVGAAATFTGVLTYEDVTNIDSVGVITARTDINLGDSIIHAGDTDTKIRFPGANEISFETTGSERVRINSTGNMGLGVASPNVLNEPAKFQELTLGGKTEGAAITLKDTDGNVQGGLFTSDVTGAMIVRTITNHFMQFRTNNTERLRIDSGGDVSINSSGLSSPYSASFRHLSINNNLILNAQNSAGGFAGMQNNAYLNSSGNWVRVNNDHATSIGTDDGVFYFRNAGAGTGNISWTHRLTILADGKIGIGDNSPDRELVVKNASSNAGVKIEASNAHTSQLFFSDTDAENVARISVFHGSGQATSNAMIFDTAGTTRTMISSDGKIGINQTSPTAFARVHIEDANGVLIAGDSQARILLRDNGGGTNEKMMDIQCDAGSISFRTIADNYTTVTPRATFRADGNFVIGNRVGTSAPSTNQPVAFHSARVTPDTASSTVSNGIRCNLYVGSNSGWAAGDGGVIGMGGSRSGGAGQEAMWAYIKGSRQSGNGWEYAGKMELGTAEWGTYNTTKAVSIYADNQFSLHGKDNTMMTFNIGGALRLLIEHTGGGNMRLRNHSSGSVTYSTSSDYRLKENESAISNALSTVKALKPYQFTWKHDNKLGQGFFAHEAQAVLPDIGVVSGTKDEVQLEDDTKHDGQWKKDDPIYQSVDYSKLVPLLTAALQEETAKREALEARVAALEGS